jgi:hypothetical protein
VLCQCSVYIRVCVTANVLQPWILHKSESVAKKYIHVSPCHIEGGNMYNMYLLTGLPAAGRPVLRFSTYSFMCNMPNMPDKHNLHNLLPSSWHAVPVSALLSGCGHVGPRHRLQICPTFIWQFTHFFFGIYCVIIGQIERHL